jgi:hypothetical protein
MDWLAELHNKQMLYDYPLNVRYCGATKAITALVSHTFAVLGELDKLKLDNFVVPRFKTLKDVEHSTQRYKYDTLHDNTIHMTTIWEMIWFCDVFKRLNYYKRFRINQEMNRLIEPIHSYEFKDNFQKAELLMALKKLQKG